LLAAPIALAQSASTPPPTAASPAPRLTFDAISIHPSKTATTTTSGGIEIERMFTRTTPDGYSVENVTLKFLIMDSYNVKWDAILGGPAWIASDHFDIDAKVTPAADAPPPKLTSAQRRQMIQSLLADRFNLVVHNETKDAPIYQLGLAKSGSKLPISTPGDTFAKGFKGIDDNPVPVGYPVLLSFGHLFGQAVTIASLVDYLSSSLHRPIVDTTGLTGKYDLSLAWTPDSLSASSPDSAPLEDTGPTIFTALQEQLGLKLTSTHGPVASLVIDHVDPPSPN
jgi:uncharacterized protein (TIGR03435 family)